LHGRGFEQLPALVVQCRDPFQLGERQLAVGADSELARQPYNLLEADILPAFTLE